MRGAAFLILLLSAPCHAALEDWPCSNLADFYGFVALDRDRGVPYEERIKATAASINKSGLVFTEHDAIALIEIVHWVYGTDAAPYQHRIAAYNRCVRGQRERPGVNG